MKYNSTGGSDGLISFALTFRCFYPSSKAGLQGAVRCARRATCGGKNEKISGGVLQECCRCLELRGKLSRGALSTCRTSLRGLLSFLDSKRGSFEAVSRSSLRSFVTKLVSINVRPHSVSQVLSKMHSFCHFLILRGRVRCSPARLLRVPGANQFLPRILALRRVSEVVNSVSLDVTRKRQGETVLRALCDYNLHIGRLYALGLSSLCLRRNFVGIAKGKDGAHLIPVSHHTIGSLRG